MVCPYVARGITCVDGAVVSSRQSPCPTFLSRHPTGGVAFEYLGSAAEVFACKPADHIGPRYSAGGVTLLYNAAVVVAACESTDNMIAGHTSVGIASFNYAVVLAYQTTYRMYTGHTARSIAFNYCTIVPTR